MNHSRNVQLIAAARKSALLPHADARCSFRLALSEHAGDEQVAAIRELDERPAFVIQQVGCLERDVAGLGGLAVPVVAAALVVDPRALGSLINAETISADSARGCRVSHNGDLAALDWDLGVVTSARGDDQVEIWVSTTIKRVVIESPYAGDIETNLRYLRACMHDCFLRGEAPYASHGLYTQPGVLRDEVPEERELGIQGGFAWRDAAEKTVVYTDLGTSTGMRYGVVDAEKKGRPIEYRQLGPDWMHAKSGALGTANWGLPYVGEVKP